MEVVGVKEVWPKLSAAPGSPVTGQVYYDTGTNKHMGYNGSTWVDLGVQGGSVTISSVSINFTDGDTTRRVTVTDAAVGTGTKIVGSIRRADTADDSVDKGYIYLFTVVEQVAGAFDLLVICADWGLSDTTEDPPNETIQFHYTLG